jgi:hypothetical protein
MKQKDFVVGVAYYWIHEPALGHDCKIINPVEYLCISNDREVILKDNVEQFTLYCARYDEMVDSKLAFYVHFVTRAE